MTGTILNCSNGGIGKTKAQKVANQISAQVLYSSKAA